MTTEEFSTEFDILYNNVSSNQAPGLDSYEKGVFLTIAQEDIIKAYFNPVYNKAHEGFDGSQKRQYDFSTLIVTTKLNQQLPSLNNNISSKNILFGFPVDYFLSLNEIISDDERTYAVIPITYTEYQKQLIKPYSKPPKKVAWRLFISGNELGTTAEIIGNFTGDPVYTLRYIKKPSPIILEDLEGVAIRGEDKKTECALPSELHPEILKRAVELAKATYIGDLGSTISLGGVSTTELGINNNTKQ